MTVLLSNTKPRVKILTIMMHCPAQAPGTSMPQLRQEGPLGIQLIQSQPLSRSQKAMLTLRRLPKTGERNMQN